MSHRLIRPALFAAVLLLSSSAAMSQYDSSGRYVPSPMGVPRDPYASTVPLYPGTPGGAKGTPTTPRGMISPPASMIDPPPKVLQGPSIDRVPPATGLPPIQLSREQCRDGWSRSTRVTKVQFNRMCRRILAR